jgi:hypothetical protein
VGSIDRRIQRLEELYGMGEDTPDVGAELRAAVLHDVMAEFGRLRSCRARGVYRGGTPPTPIQPTDPAGAALGYPYTTGELLEFAVRTVFEREREDLEPPAQAAVENLITAWTANLRDNTIIGKRWDDVQADGPPEPTPPWRGG